MASQYPPNQNFYPQPPARHGLDFWTIAIVLAGILVASMCLVTVCVVSIFTIARQPPSPSTQSPIIAAATITTGNVAPVVTAVPTVNTTVVGKFINPYLSANLAGMKVLQIDVLNQSSGNYTRVQQLTANDLAIFNESFNISVPITAPDNTCPDHVRLSITRADNSVITMGVCLKHGVILRGIPDLGGADAPMGPRFTDALINYLPQNYQNLLH